MRCDPRSKCIGLLKPAFRAIDNGSRACPPQADLPAFILVRRLCGGLADSRARPPCFWRAGLLTISQPHHWQEGEFKV
jgi:hypothetical protein